MQEYNKVDRRLHLLCQIQALITANFMDEKEDYSHTNLAFDPIGKRILSRWMDFDKHHICLAINLEKFSFEWLNPSLKTFHEIDIDGKTYGQLLIEVTKSLHEIGVTSVDLSIKPAYEIEKYPFFDLPFEKHAENALILWTKHRVTANQSCEALLRYLNVSQEVRIWPHHFDTGIYVEIGDKLGIGFGLAMQDTMVASPYFYMSGYGLHQEISMKNIPKLTSGSWKTKAWKGAILPLNDIEHISNPETNETINEFIRTTLGYYLWTIANIA